MTLTNLFECCFRGPRTPTTLGVKESSNFFSDGVAIDLGRSRQGSSSTGERSKLKDVSHCAPGVLAQLQRLLSTIAGSGGEEPWLYRIDSALCLLQEHFDADSASMYAVYGGLSYITLSACGVGAEEMARGVPHCITNDLSSSVALLLTNQLRSSSASVRTPSPTTLPTSSPLLGDLPSDWRQMHARHGLRHFMSVPVCSGDLVVGVLGLAARQGSVPPPSWQPDVLGLVAASLSLLLQARQLGVTMGIMTDVHLARNMDELVRAVRRGVCDLVVATTYLAPSLRVALIRGDGSAAAVFEEQGVRRCSYTRLSVCSDTAAPIGMPELLQPSNSRRSIDTGRLSAQQLLGQLTRERITAPYDQAGFQPPAPRVLQPSTSMSANGDPTVGLVAGRGGEGPGHSPGGPLAAAAASDSPFEFGSLPVVTLQDRLAAAAAIAAGGSFSTAPVGTNGGTTQGPGKGARGHSLSLGNTLLGEALGKDCGLWISDCALYLQEAKTFPRDIVVSRGSRAVHSIAVCAGRHNGVPLLGVYCVYSAVVPRQLLRAVTLELEQLLRLLAPSVSARLHTPALLDEWLYLHEELLSPCRVDQIKRAPRLSSSLTPDPSTHPNAPQGPGGSPILTPTSPFLYIPGLQGGIASAAALHATGGGSSGPGGGGSGVGEPASPLGASLAASVGPELHPRFYPPSTSLISAPRATSSSSAVVAPAMGVMEGVSLTSGVLTRESDPGAGDGGGGGPRCDPAVGTSVVVASPPPASAVHSRARGSGISLGLGIGTSRSSGGGAGGGAQAIRGLLSTLQSLGCPAPQIAPAAPAAISDAGGRAGSAVPCPAPRTAHANSAGSGGISSLPSLNEAFGLDRGRYHGGTAGGGMEALRAEPTATPALIAATALSAVGVSPSKRIHQPRASSGCSTYGTMFESGVGGGSTAMLANALLGSSGVETLSPVTTATGANSFGGGGGMSTAGSLMRSMLAAPSFTLESVRSNLGGGLRRAPLVSGLHEKLAAAQASRLVHGSAIEHQEELAAIEVLEKIGQGGYGEVYRGQYDGTEVAIKIVYEPHSGAASSAMPRSRFPHAVQAGGGMDDEAGGVSGTAAATAAMGRNLHDAFELTVSVSVCHPNIVQVLTFFTDVYVHVDKRQSIDLRRTATGTHPHLHPVSPEGTPSPPPLAAAAAPPGAAPGPGPCGYPGSLHPLFHQQHEHRSPGRSRQSVWGGSGGGAGAGGGGGPPPRVTLLPYPQNNMTSCQLTSVDVSPAQFAEYTALQAAMASNGSTAQQLVAGSPPAIVICMEYCDAGSLTDAIVRGAFRQPALGLYGTSQPNIKAIFATLLEVALALRHLHSLRLVHCDIKPSNVLLRTSPRDPRGFTAKLSDFGLVRLMEPCGEGGRLAIPKGVTHGTITHMAPEVLNNDNAHPHDASLDIYAFGIMMWQMVYGGRLYPGVNNSDIPTRVVLEGMRPRFSSNIPPEYRHLAESCWAANASARPSASELVLALKELLGLGPRVNGQRRYSALAPPRKYPGLLLPSSVAVGSPAGRSVLAPAVGGRNCPGSSLTRNGTFGTMFSVPDEGMHADSGKQDAGNGGRGGGGVSGGGGGTEDVCGEGLGEGGMGKSTSRSKSGGGIRTRSLSYGNFPVHIL